MAKQAQRRMGSERGAILIHTALLMLAFVAFLTFVVDYGVMWVGRRQAQNAADAGALAGAVAMAFDNGGWTDRSDAGPAKQTARQMTQVNLVWGQAPDVNITTDVTFPSLPADRCAANPTPCIRVDVYRNQQRNNALPIFFGATVGLVDQGVRATATARVAVANTSTCIRPVAIPDRWLDNYDTTTPIDNTWTDDDTFDTHDGRNGNGAPLANPDVYVPPSANSPGSGFTVAADWGTRLILKHGSPSTSVSPGFFFPIRLPDSTGGNDYRTNWAECSGVPLSIGDTVQSENGNMIGPTRQGVNDLIAQDPNAVWGDEGVENSCAQTANPCAAQSPRIVAIPVYDTGVFWNGSRTTGQVTLHIVNILGFFIERMQGQDVYGRITNVPGLSVGGGTIAPQASFVTQIQLVR